MTRGSNITLRANCSQTIGWVDKKNGTLKGIFKPPRDELGTQLWTEKDTTIIVRSNSFLQFHGCNSEVEGNQT